MVGLSQYILDDGSYIGQKHNVLLMIVSNIRTLRLKHNEQLTRKTSSITHNLLQNSLCNK
jgi:uncharacterized membrane-anchored protein YitT (DUF2179 family)